MTATTQPASPAVRGDQFEDSGLRSSLGIPSVTFMVLAGAAPLTVVGGVMPIGFAVGNGAGFPIAFVVAGIGFLLFSVGFTTMTPFVRSPGAFYAYAGTGLGRLPGAGTGFFALVSYVVLYAAIYALMGTGIQTVVSSYGGSPPAWWICALPAFAVAVFLGYRNVSLSGRVLGVLLCAEIVVVLILDFAILGSGGGPQGLSTGWTHSSVVFSGSPGLAVLFAILSYIGVEAAAVFRDEVRKPTRTIPRATYLAVTVIGAFYAFTCWAMVSAYGDSHIVAASQGGSASLLADVATKHLGSPGAHIISILYCTSVFACILTFHNILARYIFTLSMRGMLPSWLSIPHPTFRSPHRASVVGSGAAFILGGIGVCVGLSPLSQYYTWMSGMASLGYIGILVIVGVAVIVFFARNGRGELSRWSTLYAPVLALIAFLAFLVLTLDNLAYLLGDSDTGAICVVVILVAAFCAGVLIARRSSSPVDRYGTS